GNWRPFVVATGFILVAILAGVLTSLPGAPRSDGIALSGLTIQPTAAWAAANVQADALRLQAPGEEASVEILVEVVRTPSLQRPAEFFAFAESAMRAELSVLGMANLRFD